MYPLNVSYSRHNQLPPASVAMIDKEQMDRSQTLSRQGMASLIDNEQLAVSGYARLDDREQHRHSDQAVTVMGVGARPGGLQRSVSAPDSGRRGSHLGMISCLDEEQLRGTPSSTETWKKRMSMREDQGVFLCPCLARIFEEQMEENRRIQSSTQNTLTHVGRSGT